MKIISISDIHGDILRLEKLLDQLTSADLVLLVGDVTGFGHRKEIGDIIDLIRSVNRNILAVTGNCDYPDVLSYLTEEGISIEGDCRSIDGVCFAGLGASLPTPGPTPNVVKETELARRLGAMAQKLPTGSPLVLVSHQPPYKTRNDKIRLGLHVGSRSVRRFIEEYQPMVCFTAHIHEGIGIDHIDRTQVVNPGPFFKGYYLEARLSLSLESLEMKRIAVR